MKEIDKKPSDNGQQRNIFHVNPIRVIMTSIPVCYYAAIIQLPNKVLKADRDNVTQNTKTYLHFKSRSLWPTQRKTAEKQT